MVNLKLFGDGLILALKHFQAGEENDYILKAVFMKALINNKNTEMKGCAHCFTPLNVHFCSEFAGLLVKLLQILLDMLDQISHTAFKTKEFSTNFFL